MNSEHNREGRSPEVGPGWHYLQTGTRAGERRGDRMTSNGVAAMGGAVSPLCSFVDISVSPPLGVWPRCNQSRQRENLGTDVCVGRTPCEEEGRNVQAKDHQRLPANDRKLEGSMEQALPTALGRGQPWTSSLSTQEGRFVVLAPLLAAPCYRSLENWSRKQAGRTEEMAVNARRCESREGIWGKSTPGKGNSQGKGLEASTCPQRLN